MFHSNFHRIFTLVLLSRRSCFAFVSSPSIINRSAPSLLNYRKAFISTSSKLLASSSSSPLVEISPSNHGTHPLGDNFEASSSSRGDDQQQIINLDSRLSKALKSENWRQPTTIQAHAIPLLDKGYDIMASSHTGSGKSLMFCLPLVQTILSSSLSSNNINNNHVQALVISPTRELAIQTSEVLNSLCQFIPQMNVAMATGGENVKQQRKSLAKAAIVVGTPGRILQFTDERCLTLKQLKFLVIDEADRLMDLGFEPQLARIARLLSAKDQHQSVLCSATFPPSVQRIAADFLKPTYYFVSVGKVGSTQSRIKQRFEWISYDSAVKTKAVVRNVQDFWKDESNKKKSIIVFCNTKQATETIGRELIKQKFSCRILHGDKMQQKRNRTIKEFSSGKVNILVATDVAARGLDIARIGLVIQADPPNNIDTYTHRVGRTGRAGARGEAVALLNDRNLKVASGLVDLMQEAGQSVPAFLVGMAHVSKANLIQEEELITAGSGGAIDENNDGVVNEQFTGQDFRRTAVEGSYGSGRDTSYRSFDDEAYSTETVNFATSTQDENPLEENELLLVDSMDENTAAEMKFNDDMMQASTSSTKLDNSKPSKQLAQLLKDLTGSSKLGESPDAQVIGALSSKKKNYYPRLRFEYLGRFPFSLVSPELFRQSSSRRFDDTEEDSSSRLPRVLMVAEKPSIALAMAEALSPRGNYRKRRGISRALPVFEFTSTKFRPDPLSDTTLKCKVIVTSVVGHIFSLGFDDKGKNQSHSDPRDFFQKPIVKQEETTTSKLRVIDHLRALAGESDYLALWLDCDPEGENIAHEVIAITKRALVEKGNVEDRILRSRFSAISAPALRDAFDKLEKPNADLSRSVDARQELDLRIGVAFTRLLNWRCVGLARSRFSPSTRLVSYGPCQTPCLSFCVDRAKEIQQFQPQTFWKAQIEAKFPGSSTKYPLVWKNTNNQDLSFGDNATPHKEFAEQVVNLVLSSEEGFLVSDVQKNRETIPPPLGLNTVALLEAGSKAMGMSPKQVMNVAEKLYSAGFISYPRTETTKYDPNGFDVRSSLKQHAKHEVWGRSASYLLRTKYSKHGRPPLRGKDQGDHPPITPLKAATRQDVGGGAAWRVYEFVVRNFIGSLHKELAFTRRVASLKVPKTGIQEEIANFELEFVTVDSLGFSDCCPWVLRDIGASRDKSYELSSLKSGQRLAVAKATVEESKTKPPKFLQEHELISLMDKHRIGTDASMAVHVSNIIDRQYAILCDETGVPLRPHLPPRPGQKLRPRQIGRYMIPTALGMGIIDLFGDDCMDDVGAPPLLAKPAIRKRMEEEVKLIASGEFDKDYCLKKNLGWFEQRYVEFEESLSRDRLGDFGRDLCPTTESLKKWRKYGVFEDKKSVQLPSKKSSERKAKGSNPSNKSQQERMQKAKGAPKRKYKTNRKGKQKIRLAR